MSEIFDYKLDAREADMTIKHIGDMATEAATFFKSATFILNTLKPLIAAFREGWDRDQFKQHHKKARARVDPIKEGSANG